MRTVLIDAFDSFVYVIDHYLKNLEANPVVLRSDSNNAAEIRELAPDALVLGPGPGHPKSSGHIELVHEFAGEIPILGVCLGHQAIAAAFGARVIPAKKVMHGKTSSIEHDGRGVFSLAPPLQSVTRYHSLVVEESTVPYELEITARSLDDSQIMALRHRVLPIESVQFHPESITTNGGRRHLQAFLETYVAAKAPEAALD